MTQSSELLAPLKVVLGDANVLYSRVLRDYLLYAADEGAISIRWSQVILQEMVTNLCANVVTFSAEQGALLVGLMNKAFPEAQVELTTFAVRRVGSVDLPDEGDRHVLAAAVAAKADILCTDNIKDFPPAAMAAVRIELLTADAMLSRLVTEYPFKMLAAHRTSVERLTGATDVSTLAALRRAGATETADRMEALLDEGPTQP